MAIEYEVSKPLQDDVDALIDSCAEFSPLREHEVAIASCLKIKMSEADMELQPTLKLVKISDAVQLLARKRYLLVVCAYFWQHANTREKSRALHRALMQIGVESSEDGLKFKTRKPDVQEFTATVTRFGPTPGVQQLIQLFQAAAAETAEQLACSP